MKLLCFALFACAFNLLIGFTGLLSFGHAAFFGCAGYVAGHALKAWGLPSELGMLGGVLAAAPDRPGDGPAGDPPARHLLRDDHAGAGADAVLRVPAGAVHRRRGRPAGRAARQAVGMIDLGHDLTLYYVVLAIFVAGFALIVRIVHSPFGQVLKAVKENEPRAISLGYDVDRYKLLAFVLSAALAGLAGATEDRGAGLRDADRRALVDVGPGGPDDAGGRSGHADRADRRRGADHCAGEQAGRPGRLAGDA